MTMQLEETYYTNILYSIMRFVSSSALVVDILFIILIQGCTSGRVFCKYRPPRTHDNPQILSHGMSRIMNTFMINSPIQSW